MDLSSALHAIGTAPLSGSVKKALSYRALEMAMACKSVADHGLVGVIKSSCRRDREATVEQIAAAGVEAAVDGEIRKFENFYLGDSEHDQTGLMSSNLSQDGKIAELELELNRVKFLAEDANAQLMRNRDTVESRLESSMRDYGIKLEKQFEAKMDEKCEREGRHQFTQKIADRVAEKVMRKVVMQVLEASERIFRTQADVKRNRPGVKACEQELSVYLRSMLPDGSCG